MIITEKKQLEDIEKYLVKSKPLFIVGCAACATKCRTGGEKEVSELNDTLKKRGYDVAGFAVIDTPCDSRIVSRDIISKIKDINSMQLLVCACGSGAQTIHEVTDVNVVSALNTVFIGSTERIGKIKEFCQACGECRLNDNEGYCAATRCPKGMQNAPCGGVVDGKCEVNPKNDCIWYRIYKKKKSLGGYKAIKGFAKSKRIINNK
ncbi:MAG: methylenetetrahydrofolate reductase C-terminal domain-containing protein [Elusimicrobiota bacterium]